MQTFCNKPNYKRYVHTLFFTIYEKIELGNKHSANERIRKIHCCSKGHKKGTRQKRFLKTQICQDARELLVLADSGYSGPVLFR